MKRMLFLLFALAAMLPMAAQQAQEELRAHSQLFFPEFRDAKVLQSFNRSVKAKANILYKNAALCYVDEKDGKIYQATNSSILGVQFDSLVFRKVDQLAMGLVVAEQGYNALLRVTTIDMERYKELTTGGADMPFLDIDMGGVGMNQFLDLSSAEQQANKGYPLKREYYFLLKGRIVPAKEKLVKAEVVPELKTAFKNLMNDRWWSWRDEASLAKLLMYFPK